MRGENERLVIDVAHIYASSDPKEDIPVIAGDRIFVPVRGNTSLDRVARAIQILTMILQAAIFVVVLSK
jgi:hypothetical protein